MLINDMQLGCIFSVYAYITDLHLMKRHIYLLNDSVLVNNTNNCSWVQMIMS